MWDREFVIVLVAQFVVIVLCIVLTIWIVNSDMPLWLKFILLK